MEKAALIIGGWFALVGFVGVAARFFPPYDGEIAIAGAVIFGSGIIARAIAGQKH